MENQTTTTTITVTKEEQMNTVSSVNDGCGDTIWDRVLIEAEQRCTGPDAALDIWFRY